MNDFRSAGANCILLGQLAANGDCLYATAIARQIKNDFPGCRLIWAVSSLCASILENNPHIDEIWKIPMKSWDFGDQVEAWQFFENEALERYQRGDYDFAFLTQIMPGNPHNFDGTIRPALFHAYPGKITVDLQPVLHLTAEEIQQVDDFAKNTNLTSYDRVILFECAPKSHQSYVTPAFALEVAREMERSNPGKYAFILSSGQKLGIEQPGIIDGSYLSLRHMAELTKYCHLLIGCSSGITCVASSSCSHQIPTLQLLRGDRAMFASHAYDRRYLGMPCQHIIELYDANQQLVLQCLRDYLALDWETLHQRYHQNPSIDFSYYTEFMENCVIKAADTCGLLHSLKHTTARFGWNPQLEAILLKANPHGVKPSPHLNKHFYDLTLKELQEEALKRYVTIKGFFGIQSNRIMRTNHQSLRANTCLLTPQTIEPGLTRQYQRFFEAGKDFEKLENYLSKDSLTPLNERLGDLHWQYGNHTEALESYRLQLEKDPEDVYLQYKATRLACRTQADKASQQLPRLVIVEKKQWPFILARALAATLRGRLTFREFAAIFMALIKFIGFGSTDMQSICSHRK